MVVPADTSHAVNREMCIWVKGSEKGGGLHDNLARDGKLIVSFRKMLYNINKENYGEWHLDEVTIAKKLCSLNTNQVLNFGIFLGCNFREKRR